MQKEKDKAETPPMPPPPALDTPPTSQAQPTAAKRSLFASHARGEREAGGFIEGEGEASALRRYQYTDRLVEDGEDGEDGEEDDGNEYYI